MAATSDQRVLFVCLGNICRSPTAHGVFRTIVRQADLSARIAIDSAGTGAWHAGSAPDKRAAKAALVRGYDISDLRARQVRPRDFEEFNYILAMDHDNLAELQQQQPANFNGHLGLFLDFCRDASLREVPDPYYGGTQGFETVLDLVEDAAAGLLDHLRSK